MARSDEGLHRLLEDKSSHTVHPSIERFSNAEIADARQPVVLPVKRFPVVLGVHLSHSHPFQGISARFGCRSLEKSTHYTYTTQCGDYGTAERDAHSGLLP